MYRKEKEDEEYIEFDGNEFLKQLNNIQILMVVIEILLLLILWRVW